MKLKIGNYDVEIKAKNRIVSESEDEDTMYLLNDIAMWACEGAKYNRDRGYTHTSKDYKERWREIVDFLIGEGFLSPDN